MTNSSSPLYERSGPGWVYLFNNATMPGLVKIGRSVHPEERRRELSRGTSVPVPFALVHKQRVRCCARAEREIHSRLGAYRLNPRREFFRIPVVNAIRVVDEVCSRWKIDTPENCDGPAANCQILNSPRLHPPSTSLVGCVLPGAVLAALVVVVAAIALNGRNHRPPSLRAFGKKGSGTVVRSTLWAVPATVPDPFFPNALSPNASNGNSQTNAGILQTKSEPPEPAPPDSEPPLATPSPSPSQQQVLPESTPAPEQPQTSSLALEAQNVHREWRSAGGPSMKRERSTFPLGVPARSIRLFGRIEPMGLAS